MTNHTNHIGQAQIKREIHKILQARESSMMSMMNCTSCPHQGPTVTATTNMTSCSIVSANFYAKTKHKSGNTKTQNPK